MNPRIVLLVLAALAALAGCVLNPVTGEQELSLVSAAGELELGDSIHPAVIYEYDGEYPDPELKRYLGTIVQRLHRVSHRADMPVDFKVLNSSIFNAFAIPGHVYVTRGALAHITNEAEFAAVMGHELAHYTARHSAKQLTQQQLTGIGLSIAGLLVPEDDSLVATAILGVGVLGVKLAELHYSRSQEEQADRVGTYYLYRAGYEPSRMLDLQRLLHKVAGGGESSFLAEYFSTHPSEETRLRRIEEVIHDEKLDDGALLQGDGTFAARWQQRLGGLREAQKAYDVFDQAGALAVKGEHARALQLCRQAQSMAVRQAPFFRLEGDLLRATGRASDAVGAYRRAIEVDRRYQPAVRGLGAANLA
ncbi:MAG: M48 family metalloprotease, partial [Planctomycetes bacterium]|nr:M48 family metalloprotease [Planctomycetota bacterium]